MLKTKKIMLADDEAGIRSLLQGILVEQGFEVTTACDGLEALERLKGKRYDLLITDIDMPRLNGIELLKRMRLIRRKEKVLVMTGRCLDHEDLSSDFPNVLCLLRKPFRISYFVETVNSILAPPAGQKKTLLRANRRS